MAATIPTIEPTQFTAGDTVKWTKTLADYPASSYTYTCVYVNSSATFTATGTADGDTHSITITAATSATLTAGTYNWQAYVTGTSSGERYQVGAGTCTVKPNFAAGAADVRSHVKKVLDAIESVIAGRASEDASSMSVAGRSITKMTLDELIVARDRYRAEYQRELRAERISAGLGHSGKVRIRFKN